MVSVSFSSMPSNTEPLPLRIRSLSFLPLDCLALAFSFLSLNEASHSLASVNRYLSSCLRVCHRHYCKSLYLPLDSKGLPSLIVHDHFCGVKQLCFQWLSNVNCADLDLCFDHLPSLHNLTFYDCREFTQLFPLLPKLSSSLTALFFKRCLCAFWFFHFGLNFVSSSSSSAARVKEKQ